MAGRTIVLAHGVLGFGHIPGLPSLFNYFNGVAAHLRRSGHTVIAPQVNPIGPLVQRGAQLAAAILAATSPGDRVHILAHSMGGLDARHAITHVDGVRARVATLVTIGTPHQGSPVADAIVARAGPLLAHIPAFIVEQLQRNAGALEDLTTAGAGRLEETTPDVPGVRYVEVASDASRGGRTLLLFKLAVAIGRLQGEINDGVVTRSSALRRDHEHLSDWPVDHFGQVGWSLTSPIPREVSVPLLPPPAHFDRYDAIVDGL